MAELSVGTQVRLSNGSTCRVKKELGRGGQGIVYLVDYCGKDYALKWYIVQYPDSFYENLDRNVKKGAPSPSFLWPVALAERQHGSFGYLMELRPSGYEEIGSYMLLRARFASVDALLEACLQICTGFQKLHINGFSYQDMNDGNFFINPKTGQVLICDNDNVAPNGVNMGILGKTGYMAPEIVDAESMPNKFTDYFSLSVILFILIYMNRPFEGAKALAFPAMTPEFEKRLNGKNGVFILDPADASNRPVNGIHKNVIKILIQVRSQYVTCPHCGEKVFITPGAECVCLECKRTVPKTAVLAIGLNSKVALVPGQKLYKCHTDICDDYTTVAAEVVRNPKDPKIWGIRNLSGKQWTVTLPDKSQRLVDHGSVMPVRQGLEIRFSSGIKAEIV